MVCNTKWLVAGFTLFFCHLSFSDASAQQVLSLDSCRAMALRNNKQMGVQRLKRDVAKNLRKSARTKYLPHVSALGSYMYTSKEFSLLNNDQKTGLQNLGTSASATMQSGLGAIQQTMGGFSQIFNAISPVAGGAFDNMAASLQTQIQQNATTMTGQLNTEGQKIVDAFRTDTRNIWAGSVMVTQPVFMGGAITALNRMADINEQLAENSAEASQQQVIYAIDQAYWQVVSLKHKQELAESFLQLVTKLDDDVQKMIREGVATRSDGLGVSVKVNEAEMTLQKVNDGLTLSRMLLCQMIGLPVNEQITLIDEEREELETVPAATPAHTEQFIENRPELKMLDNSVAISREVTHLLKAGNLPQVALMGGYSVSNPNVLNGFENKFGGFWNVGVLVRVPIWNWGDFTYKVRASKGATAIAQLERDEAREKMELQVSQSTFKVDEAAKRLAMAKKSIERANENLRTANLGFKEGVISPTVVLEAQTAWLQAKSQIIDAEIDVKLSQVNLQKALGELRIEN